VNTSEKGITLIKYFEGVHATPYRCSAGYWTVGVGHLISYDDKLLSSWDRTLSDDEINNLLKNDLKKFENGVIRLLHPKQPNQSEFDALVSFSFNLGLGTLQRSSIRSKLNRGDKEGAIETLLKYCRAGGKILRGLERRRAAEADLFFSHIK